MMRWKLLELDREVAVVAAAAGSVYASAPSGLYRSQDDGATWRRLRDPVSLLAAAPDGIWSATRGRESPADLQFSADGEAWTPVRRLPVNAREVNELTVLSVAPSGEVWVALRQKWLGSYPSPAHPVVSQHAELAADFVFRGSRDRPFELVPTDQIRVTGIAFDSRGRTWTSTSGGVFVDGQRVFDTAADCIAVDADDRIVISTCMSACVSQGGRFEPIPVRTVGSIQCDLRQCNLLARGSDGAVWAGTSSGIFRLDKMTWCSVNTHRGLVEVVSLAFTRDKAFAVGRGVGLLCGVPATR